MRLSRAAEAEAGGGEATSKVLQDIETHLLTTGESEELARNLLVSPRYLKATAEAPSPWFDGLAVHADFVRTAAAEGFTVATLETYKTFFFPTKPRGKFANKPILFYGIEDMAEAGIKDFVVTSWGAFVMPKATPPAVVPSELRRLTRRAYQRFRYNFNQSIPLVGLSRLARDRFFRMRDAQGGRTPYDPGRNHPIGRHDIVFVGLWDTVDAYGLPIDELTRGVDRWIWPLSFPELRLSDKVEKACHALSLDGVSLYQLDGQIKGLHGPVHYEGPVAARLAPLVPAGIERRLGQAVDVQVLLEGVDLPAERVASHRDVQPADRLLPGRAVLDPVGQHDHAGARAEGGQTTPDGLAQRLEEVEDPGELDHRGRLAAGDDEAVARGELGGTAYGHGVGTQRAEGGEVLTHVALQGEDADDGIHERRS